MSSQRRSRRSGRSGGDLPARVEAVRAHEGRARARCDASPALVAPGEQLDPRRVQLIVELFDQSERPRREDLPVAGCEDLEFHAASDSNCCASVDPRRASVEDWPPLTISATRSKYPAPTSRWLARCRVTGLFQFELALLELHVGGHSAGRVAAGQLEHGLVQRVEARQRDELEAVAELVQRLPEAGDLTLVQMPLPVERRRAVVREELAREALVDRGRELAGLPRRGQASKVSNRSTRMSA